MGQYITIHVARRKRDRKGDVGAPISDVPSKFISISSLQREKEQCLYILLTLFVSCHVAIRVFFGHKVPPGTRGAVLEGGRRHIDPAGVYTVHFLDMAHCSLV